MLEQELQEMSNLSKTQAMEQEKFRTLAIDLRNSNCVEDMYKCLEAFISFLKYALSNEDYFIKLDEKDNTWQMNTLHAKSEKFIYLENEFDIFWDKIIGGENFAFIRNADGELAIMQGRAVAAQENNWKSPNYITKLGHDLLNSLKMMNDNVYYAISCPCCDPKAYFWYLDNIENRKNITFANLWINSNYEKFTAEFPKLVRDTVLIANYRAKDKKIGNLNILKHYPISDDCIEFWEKEADEMIKSIIRDFGDENNLLYAVSAGPMSGVIIERLYKNNPNNCYIDFGSSLDIYYRENISRPYMLPNNIYAKRKCWIINPKTQTPDVTVVLTCYKRPEILLEQLEAVERQSLKPKEIILFQDAIENSVYSITLNEEIKKRFDNVKIASENQGVWGRFEYALTANTEYVCIFDDDTIPGNRWLENCYISMIQKNGIYGTVGIELLKDEQYPIKNYYRVGWAAPNNIPIEVDFVGHSWFVKKEYLNVMLEQGYDFKKSYKKVGEDAFLSYSNAKNNIPTIVPSHYYEKQEFWGSMPNKAYHYGADEVAISFDWGNLNIMMSVIMQLKNSGWKTLAKENESYVKSSYNKIMVTEENENFILHSTHIKK